ncbi:MAG: deoxyribose-phosphate aldolase, partial [Myxococcota bacterium]|nr:deoxyribose-phosphate aldolase [Myxococcota bacterium]
RPKTQLAGRLVLLAVDHPARNVTAIGDRPLAMADRADLLDRTRHVLLGGAADGVMASMDVLEELLLLDYIGPAFLEGKVLLASLNRGGLAGSVWELDDPVTGPTPDDVMRWNLDGGKLLLRVAHDDPASLRTLQACAAAIRKLNALRLATFLEPLPVKLSDHRWTVDAEASALARLVGVASALGDGASRTWLKLPWCEDFATVARATTLPIVLLGGPTGSSSFTEQLADAIGAGSNVRGAMVGRRILYADDPLEAAREVHALVHGEPR